MSDISIGVIGTGGMGTRHAMNLHNHIVGAHVVAVYDLDQARAAKVAVDCRGARVFDAPHSLINSDKVDAVVIVSPDDTHAEFALACLRAGKPVLCEKPLGVTTQQALQVVEAEAALGKRLLSLGFMRRFDPQHVGVKRAIVAGQLGRPLLFKGYSRESSMPPNVLTDTLLTNSFIHDFDAMRWLMGQDATEVYVRGVRTREHLGPNSHDLLLIQFALSGGGLATIEGYHSAEYGYDIFAEVVCERGVAETMQPDAARVKHQHQSGLSIHPDWLSRFQPAYVIEFQEWVDSLHGKRAFTGATAWDGYQAVLIAEACLQSLRSGQPAALQAVTKPNLYSV
jgi:myo-inositol 2-dehydrogenase / D-chiro-inositol 1-dehydrogenase